MPLSDRSDEMRKEKTETVKKSKPRRKNRGILFSLLIFLGFFLYRLAAYALDWAQENCEVSSFSQIVFHLKVPIEGTSRDMITDFIKGFLRDSWAALLIAAVLAAVFIVLMSRKALEKRLTVRLTAKSGGEKSFSFLPLIKTALSISVIFAILSQFSIAYKRFDVGEYIHDRNHTTTLYDDYYVSPEKVKITFPEKKKNLIYIFCESMEMTYSSKEYGGDLKENLIPELTEIALENQSFSGRHTLGGAHALANSTWTSGGMVAQTSGVTLNFPLTEPPYTSSRKFLPGAVSLGEILRENGYNQTLIIGSNAEFGGREYYFKQHGNYDIFDLESAKRLGKIPKNYYNGWGYEDEKLFQYAKEIISESAANEDPFNVTLLTVDTHFPNGIVCRNCGDKYDGQYKNVIACSSKQIADFVGWIQKQSFADDTTVIISGDHFTMSNTATEWMDKNYDRRTFVSVINGPEPKTDEKRVYTTLDMFPTTLASLGCTIEGDRLGLGTNLYSDTPTLAEQLGLSELNRELSLKSPYYEKNILGGK